MDSFRSRLVAFYEQAGRPSPRELDAFASRKGWTLPRQKTHALLKGTSTPRWETVEVFLQAVAGTKQVKVDINDWLARYNAASRPRRADGPLLEPYREVDTAETPVRLLRAEYGMVPFQSRDELTVLLDWCQKVDRTGLVVIHGVGGAGKTRLALELADRLRQLSWYAGVLPRRTDPIPLATVTEPVLTVLDYADGRIDEVTALLRTLRTRTGSPAVVVLTARSVEGQWLTEIIASLDDDRHPYRRETMALPDQHPDPAAIYRAALGAGELPDASGRWTTLDLILLAWLRTNSPTTAVVTRADLYKEVLRHEENYWTTVYRDLAPGPRPDRALLRRAAAAVTLVAPEDERADDAVLAVVAGLADDPGERRIVRRVLRTCLDPDPGEGLVLRPDPVGDHLLRDELTADPTLLPAAIKAAGPGGIRNAVATLDRAGQGDPEAAVAAITGLVESNPDWWRDVLAVAAKRRGPALTALERLAERPDSPLPLAEVSAAVPFSPIGLFNLGLILDRKLLDQATDAPALVRAARPATDAGDYLTSLTWITRAVELYRTAGDSVGLAEALWRQSDTLNSLARYEEAVTSGREAVLLSQDLDNELLLAAARTNLSAALSMLAQGDEAVPIAEEAVAGYRQAANLDGLAGGLINLGTILRRFHRDTEALQALTEGIDHYQRVVAESPDLLSVLAAAVHNAGITLEGEHRYEEAITYLLRAVNIHRTLAEANPGASAAALATSLTNLSGALAEVGRLPEAIVAGLEAVDLGRRFAADPVHLAQLAESLNALGIRLLHVGRYNAADTAMAEAVDICRQLAGTATPYVPALAMMLNNHGEALHRVNRGEAALAAVTEAVELRRRLTTQSAGYLPDLAVSLVNQGARLADLDRHAGAFAATVEAVALLRPLAGESTRYLHWYAFSLAQLGARLAALDLPAEAVAPLHEAIRILRPLAVDSPAERLALVTALGRVSQVLRTVGTPEEVLAAAEEAVVISRSLSDVVHDNVHLAEALDNLSGHLTDFGRAQDALPLMYQSLAIRRELAARTPGQLPGLVELLHDIATELGRSGVDHEEAHELLRESVTRRRELVATDPATHLPRLAHSLNYLVIHSLRADNVPEALEASGESVAIYRKLVLTDTTLVPALADALANRSGALTADGDYPAAFAATREAVDHYRVLGHRAQLAVTLGNLGIGLAAMDRADEARDAFAEATEIQYELTVADPVARLPRLVKLLAHLPPGSGVDEWRTAVDSMPNDPTRAELRAALARHLRTTDIDQAVAELRLAASEAAHPADPGLARVLTRARWAIRAQALELGLDDLPAWATGALDPAHADFVGRTAAATEPNDLLALLADNRRVLADPALPRTMRLLMELNPHNPRLANTADLIDDVTAAGVDDYVTKGQAALSAWSLVNAWATTPNPAGFYVNHRAQLDTDEVRHLLTSQADTFGEDAHHMARHPRPGPTHRPERGVHRGHGPDNRREHHPHRHRDRRPRPAHRHRPRLHRPD